MTRSVSSRIAALVAIPVVSCLAACGGASPTALVGTSRTPTATSSPLDTRSPSTASSLTPSAIRAPATVGPAVLVPVLPAYQTLNVVDLSGHVVGTVSLSAADTNNFGVGPHHVWVTHGSALLLYGASGALLATDSYSAASFSSGPVFTADGSRWAWAWSPNQAQLSASTTTIFVGTQASQMRAVATHTDPIGQRLTPIAWTPDGTVYLTDYQDVGGGRFDFAFPQTAWSLDPSTGALTELSASCHLQDVLPDGSLLCLQGSALSMVRPPATIATLPVPGGWQNYGDAHYSAQSGKVLISAVSHLPSLSPAATYLTSRGGSAQQVSSDAYGAHFLPDGRLLDLRSNGWVVIGVDGRATAPILPASAVVWGILNFPDG
jgi:hypothetical protein